MGFGDDIMTTGAARAVKQAHPDVFVLIGEAGNEYHSPMFEGNPNIAQARSVPAGARTIWISDFPGKRPYIDYPRSTAEHMAYREIEREPGDLFLSQAEVAAARLSLGGLKDFVLIEPNIKTHHSASNKDWGFDRWQSVVDRLQGELTLVQCGPPGVRILRGVTRCLTGTFREACAVLNEALCYLGPEGGLHHAAAALQKSAVVIFGGYISPAITGYELHCNIYRDIEGSPCGSLVPCMHCKACMDLISVDDVCGALHQTIFKNGEPKAAHS